jgi:L-alanine-DL-glutamate epimerase-like enolase superfamily enzyme
LCADPATPARETGAVSVTTGSERTQKYTHASMKDASSVIRAAHITRYELPAPRVIGDSQVRYETLHIGALELETEDHRGLGFFEAPAVQGVLPPLVELEQQLTAHVAPGVLGERAEILLDRRAGRGDGTVGSHLFIEAVDQALWDLFAQQLDLPLYRLLGGTEHRVPAYASGLEFHLDADDVATFFTDARDQGFTAFKVKVGHPDLSRDVVRLTAVREIVGPGARIMADANEAWSPTEAVRRLHAFRDEGLELYWIEDPCRHDDFEGLQYIAASAPFVNVNCGEYLDLAGKRKLLEHRAVDILNVHGHLSEAMGAARLATEAGIPVSVGNTLCDVGVHVAAALRDVVGLEFSSLDYGRIVEEPIVFKQGSGFAPERPGHGLVLSASGRSEFGRP